MISARDDERVIAGVLLVVGSLLFFVAIAFIVSLADPSGRSIVSLPNEARLPLIAANAARWEWGWAFGIAGIVVTALGLVVFQGVLRSAGDRVLARLGLTAFLLGAVLTVAGRAQEVSVAIWAARPFRRMAPCFHSVAWICPSRSGLSRRACKWTLRSGGRRSMDCLPAGSMPLTTS